jgi:hypothetical protein
VAGSSQLLEAARQHGVLSLDSTPNDTFRVEFFHNATCGTASQGETFLGFLNIGPEADGVIELADQVISSAFTFGGITATATSSSGSTSEFSNCVMVDNISGGGGTPIVEVPASTVSHFLLVILSSLIGTSS